MPRRMSCSMIIDAVRDRTKTVTRRQIDTWHHLAVGERLTLIEKGMGLPKGATQVVLAEVEVTDVRIEQLRHVDEAECVREGFPDLSPHGFRRMWADAHGHRHIGDEFLDLIVCRRIEWRYCDD